MVSGRPFFIVPLKTSRLPFRKQNCEEIGLSLARPIMDEVLASAEEVLNIERHTFGFYVLNFFKKKDYQALNSKLKDKKEILQWISNKLESNNKLNKTEKGGELLELSTCLIDLVDVMIFVCEGLDLKSKGMPYSSEQHKNGLTLIQGQKAKCKQAAEICHLAAEWSKLTSKWNDF